MYYLEIKNKILKGLTSSPVVRLPLTDEIFPVLLEMEREGAIRIIWDETGKREKENIIIYRIP